MDKYGGDHATHDTTSRSEGKPSAGLGSFVLPRLVLRSFSMAAAGIYIPGLWPVGLGYYRLGKRALSGLQVSDSRKPLWLARIRKITC